MPDDLSNQANIIHFVQCDPEYRLYKEFQRFTDEMALGRAGLDSSGLFMQGHPLYLTGMKEGEEDSLLPLVGVEWQMDMENDKDLGDNKQGPLALTDELRKFISGFKDRGETLFTGHTSQLTESQYEQLSHRMIDDILTREGYVVMYTRHVVSLLGLSGWATGGATGRKLAQFLYQAVDSVAPFVMERLNEELGVTVQRFGDPQVNIESQLQQGRVYGFEMLFHVRQIKRTVRFLRDYKPVRTAEIHLENSKSKLSFDYLGK